MKTIEIGTWWSPREEIRTGYSMRVVSRDGDRVCLEHPLWGGHVLSWDTTVVDLVERWVEVV